MASTLTAAGIKLCLSLGVLNPTVDKCDTVLMASQPPGDSFGQSPVKITSIPNDMHRAMTDVIKEDGPWEGCINYATYETYTGKKNASDEPLLEDNGDTEGGKSYYCWRTGKLIWIPEAGRWEWNFGK